MSGDKQSKCNVNNVKIDLFNADIQNLDEYKLGYIQDNTGIDNLSYQQVL